MNNKRARRVHCLYLYGSYNVTFIFLLYKTLINNYIHEYIENSLLHMTPHITINSLIVFLGTPYPQETYIRLHSNMLDL